MIKFFACGDIVNFTSKSDFVDNSLKTIINSCDLAICNFEAPIKTSNSNPIKKAGPHVFQASESIKYIKDAGFNMVSLANNHIYDYGQQALANTINELQNQGIDFVGAGLTFDKAYQTRIVNKNGVKLAIIAGCENEFGCLFEYKNKGGYAWLFHNLIEDNIRELKKQVDFIILIAHAGIEEIDFPIKEWRDRYKRLCDVGVDLIIGHHPHVPQGYEKYKMSTIFYSLGNFYFDTVGFEDKSDDSYSVVFEITKSGLKDFVIIWHKKIDGQTQKVNKEELSFSLEDLNKLLLEDYERRNNQISLKLFKDYYCSYYEESLGVIPSNSTFVSRLKFITKKLLSLTKSTDERNLLLLHNIRIDSHRFLVQRALSLLSER